MSCCTCWQLPRHVGMCCQAWQHGVLASCGRLSRRGHCSCCWPLTVSSTLSSFTIHARPPHPTPPALRSYAKGFAAMGALFAGSECLIESYRARHDSRNSVYAGCATGAILGYSGGPKAMCIGCASFAAFSVLIDRWAVACIALGMTVRSL